MYFFQVSNLLQNRLRRRELIEFTTERPYSGNLKRVVWCIRKRYDGGAFKGGALIRHGGSARNDSQLSKIARRTSTPGHCIIQGTLDRSSKVDTMTASCNDKQSQSQRKETRSKTWNRAAENSGVENCDSDNITETANEPVFHNKWKQKSKLRPTTLTTLRLVLDSLFWLYTVERQQQQRIRQNRVTATWPSRDTKPLMLMRKRLINSQYKYVLNTVRKN